MTLNDKFQSLVESFDKFTKQYPDIAVRAFALAILLLICLGTFIGYSLGVKIADNHYLPLLERCIML